MSVDSTKLPDGLRTAKELQHAEDLASKLYHSGLNKDTLDLREVHCVVGAFLELRSREREVAQINADAKATEQSFGEHRCNCKPPSLQHEASVHENWCGDETHPDAHPYATTQAKGPVFTERELAWIGCWMASGFNGRPGSEETEMRRSIAAKLDGLK